MTSAVCLSEADFRQALSRFATGVVIITTRNDMGRPRAITVNAFTSVSLDPPLVLFCLGKSAFHFSVFAEARSFAINILTADQQALSDRFAQEVEDDLADLSTVRLLTGSPILPECLAILDCRAEAMHDAGDHLIVIGRVCAIRENRGGEPLLFFNCRYDRLRPSADG